MIVHFLEDKIKNYDDIFLHDIWSFDDNKIEKVHNFIQWVFPLDEVSRRVPSAPVLFDEELIEIKKSALAKFNLLKSREWFIQFLERTDMWELRGNHNHSRISRMIKSLRLLHGEAAADVCLEKVLRLANARAFGSPNVMKYWEKC